MPCLVLFSITFESFGTDSEMLQPAPLGARAQASGHMCGPGAWACFKAPELTSDKIIPANISLSGCPNLLAHPTFNLMWGIHHVTSIL